MMEQVNLNKKNRKEEDKIMFILKLFLSVMLFIEAIGEHGGFAEITLIFLIWSI